MSTVNEKLGRMGLELPKPAAALASYVPFQQTRNLLFISGQLPFRNGEIVKGTLGEDLGTEEGAQAAQLCALGIVSQISQALSGDYGRIRSIIKLEGFVAATPSFKEHPEVINGASDLMQELFCERGRHSRTAVGVSSLPRGAAVEIAAIISID
jgi:enamine deaminase RidA (YjgF/YER057c/UK114 family)